MSNERVTNVEYATVNGRKEVVSITIADPTGLTAAHLRGVKLGQLVHGPAAPSQPTARLARPDRADPDEFAQRVAEAYEQASRVTSAPAKALAEEAGVPVTTVHRWIREARRAGALGPARKGRAG